MEPTGIFGQSCSNPLVCPIRSNNGRLPGFSVLSSPDRPSLPCPDFHCLETDFHWLSLNNTTLLLHIHCFILCFSGLSPSFLFITLPLVFSTPSVCSEVLHHRMINATIHVFILRVSDFCFDEWAQMTACSERRMMMRWRDIPKTKTWRG